MKEGAIGEFFCDTPSEASQVVSFINGTQKTVRSVTKTTKASSRKRTTSKFGLWEPEEVRILLENKDNGSAVARNPVLRERHTKGAIQNALSSVRSTNYFSPRFKSLVVAEMNKMRAGAPVEA